MIELTVSLMVGGLVVLAAVELIRAVDDSARGASRAARASADASNAETAIGEWVFLSRQGHASPDREHGDAEHFRVATRCLVAEGWHVACQLDLRVTGDGRDRLMGLTSIGDSVMFDRRDGALRLVYLDVYGGTQRWSPEWNTDDALPLAIGVVGASDTLVLRRGYTP